MADQITAPEPQVGDIQGFSDEDVKKWKSDWVKAFKQAVVDFPGDEIAQRTVATREANRMFRVEHPASYGEAVALPARHVIFRGNTASGKFGVVTIDGKKHYFDVPAARAEEAAPAKTK